MALFPDRQPAPTTSGQGPLSSRSAFTVLGVCALGLGLVAGCASPGGPTGGPGSGLPGGPGGPGMMPMQRLFVSPFGEVFTSEPHEPWAVSDWFITTDENLDGQVNLAEFQAQASRAFARLDTDQSGTLEPFELNAYETRLRAQTGRRPFQPGGDDAPVAEDGAGGTGGRPPGADGGDRDGPGGGRPGMGGPGGGGPGGGDRAGPPRGRGGAGGPRSYGIVAEAGFFNVPQPVKAADVNVDQRVTAQEWAQMVERRFLVLDSDRDGHLTLATLPQTPLQRRSAQSSPPADTRRGPPRDQRP